MEYWGFKMATNYIYKYVRDSEIIYIGKTKNLQQRHKQHLQEAGKFLETDELYYFLCPTSNIMDVYETALINKYHPILNKADNISTIDIIVKEPDWYLYKEINKKEKQQKNYQNISIDTSFTPKHYTKFFEVPSIPTYENLEFPLLSVIEWKLLLVLKLKLSPVTTKEYIQLMYDYSDGNIYKRTRESANKLYEKKLCNLIDENTFIITQAGIDKTPYTDEEILFMLSFTSKYDFALYPFVRDHKTITAEDLKCNYKEYNEAKRNILDPTLAHINIIFNKKYNYTTIKQGRSVAFITFIED